MTAREEGAAGRIAALLERGELDAARALAQAALGDSAQAGDPRLQALLGEIAARDGYWEQACEHLEAALAHECAAPLLARLAECSWRAGRLERALDCYARWAQAAPAASAPELGLANVLHALGRHEEALERLARAERLGERARVYARRGCIYTSLGRYEDAQREFRAAAELDRSLALLRVIAFDRELYERLRAGPELPPPPVLARAGAPDRCRFVLFTACDGRYYRKYGAYFLASHAAHGPRGAFLHWHIHDPDAEVLERMRRDLARAGVRHYAISGSRVALAGATEYARDVFYGCGRFLYFPAWLEGYRKPILACDVDAVLEERAEDLLAFAAEADAGLLARAPADSPWLDVVAYVMAINPSRGALDYFRLVRNYVRHFLAAGEVHWFMEQIALYCSLRMLERFAAAPRVAWFPAELVRGAIWHLGHAYAGKLADERLARYRRFAEGGPPPRPGIARWLRAAKGRLRRRRPALSGGTRAADT